MKKVMKSLILALVLSSGFSAMAGDLNDYPQIRETLNNDNLALYTLWGCLEDGYTKTESTYDPIYYIVAPQGAHTEGTVTVTMTRRSGGNMSLQTDYVFIKINIESDANGNRKIGTMTVERMRVY